VRTPPSEGATVLQTLLIALALPLTSGCQTSPPRPAAAPAAAAAAGPAWPGATTWAVDPLWDDGLAEVAVYDARRIRYGKERAFTARLITVKEDFNAAYQVKADPPYAGKTLVPVLKLNVVETVPTDNYDYHLLTSVFVRRDRLDRTHKLTLTMHEWCGNTYKEYRGWAPEPRFHFHSYFDGQGDRDWTLGLGEAGLLDEQLPLTLRSLPFAEGVRREVALLDPLVLRSLAQPPAVQRATLTVEGRENVSAGGGAIDCWRVALDRPGGPDEQLWFETAPPNLLVRLEADDGRRLLLIERTRRRYW
jgi:hypothetical protein